MYLYDIDVEILVNGKPVKKFSHEGKTFIQANKGSAYSIKIKNNSGKRRMFTVSVDGINVVDGKAAGASNIGYVLNGYSSYDIAGFRTSNEEVHLFKFNDKRKSYAAKSDETNGDISNCGVIGVQVYEEKEKPQPIIKHIHHHHTEKEYVPVPYRDPWYPHYPYKPWRQPDIIWSSTSAPNTFGNSSTTYTLTNSVNLHEMSAGGNSMQASYNADSQIRCANYFSAPQIDEGTTVTDCAAGTEFSKEAVTDRVTNTNFDTGELLVTLEIFYDFREGLIRKGVPVFREVKVAAPQAFPSRFCKPPKD